MDIAEVRQSSPKLDHLGNPLPFHLLNKHKCTQTLCAPRVSTWHLPCCIKNQDSHSSYMGSLPLASGLARSSAGTTAITFQALKERAARKLSQRFFEASCLLAATGLKVPCQKYIAGDSQSNLSAAFWPSSTFQPPLHATGKGLPVKLLRDKQSLTCGLASSNSQKMMADSGCSDARVWLMAAL